jgi:hypothetical protein
MQRSSPPFIDEHNWRIQAPADVVWKSLVKVLNKTMNGGQWFVRILRCDPSTGTQSFEGKIGETLPGFRVETCEANKNLVLCGSHRFASYKLVFIIDGEHLRALTYAEFPGVLGRIYRAGVISSGAHRIFTRRLLSQVGRRCKRKVLENGTAISSE